MSPLFGPPGGGKGAIVNTDGNSGDKVFVGDAAPSTVATPVVGDVWLKPSDANKTRTKIWDGTKWNDGRTVLEFSFTGSPQAWVVPAGVTEIEVELAGAQGVMATSAGGTGARIIGSVIVTPGETLTLNVGGQPARGAAGINGGGIGGGGASDVRRAPAALADRLIVAGGGGGGGDTGTSAGGAGGVVGQAGTNHASRPGKGATTAAGGAGGVGTTNGTGTAGVLGVGGNGREALNGAVANHGGGGGGLYGGGGAGSHTSPQVYGGGGGSSLVPSGGSLIDALRTGNGYVTIRYL